MQAKFTGAAVVLPASIPERVGSIQRRGWSIGVAIVFWGEIILPQNEWDETMRILVLMLLEKSKFIDYFIKALY
jgi:hypothetical protein